MYLLALKPGCSPTGDLILSDFSLDVINSMTGNRSSEPGGFSTTSWSADTGNSTTDGGSADAGVLTPGKSSSDAGDSTIGVWSSDGSAAGGMLDSSTLDSERLLGSC